MLIPTLLTIALAGAAQPPGGFTFEAFGPTEGLPGGQIRALTVSPANRLLVGTETGAASFDGERFEVLPSPEQASQPFVVGLHATEREVYVQASEGLFVIRDGEAQWLQRERVSQMAVGFAEDDEGAVYLANQHGVFRIQRDDVERIADGGDLRPRTVLPTETGLWVGAWRGLYRLEDGQLVRHGDTPVRALTQDEEGLLVGSERGIYRWADQPELLWEGCFVTDLVRFGDDRLAATCGGGVNLQAPDGSWESFHVGRGLPGLVFTRAEVDHEGTLWLASLDQGLLRVDQPDLRLWGMHTGLRTNRVGHLYPLGDTLYLGSANGAWAIGPDLEPRQLLNPEAEDLHTSGEVYRWFPRPSVFSVFPVQAGAYIQDSAGALHLLRADGERETIPMALEEEFWFLEHPSAIGVGAGITAAVVFEAEGMRSCEYPAPNMATAQGPAGWPSFAGGDALWEIREGCLERTGELPEGCEPSAMTFQGDEAWVACKGALWHRGRTWRRVNSDALGAEEQVRALATRGDELWFTTLAGLHRLNGGALDLEPVHGLPRLSFIWATLTAHQGWLVACTSEGLLWVRPEGLRPPPQPPEAWIQSIHANGRELRDLTTIGPDDSHIRLTLASSSLGGPDRVRYRFQLDDEPPSEPFANPELQLAGLSAGHHRLLIWASAMGSDWSTEPAALVLRIPPHWWERKDVQLGLVLLAFVIAGLVWRERARRLRLQLRIMEEQEAFRQVFGRFVDPDIAEEALAGRLSSNGELREVTVLFVDMRGFTPMSERLPPERMVELLNAWFTLMVEQVELEDGVVNKFMGDALVAIFGAPQAQPDHAERAVRTALAMVKVLQRENDSFEERFGERVLVGIGINSGDVIAGPIGAESRMEYTVIGEAVNIAARLEALTRHVDATILLPEETAKLLGPQLALVPMGEHRLKGVSTPVKVWKAPVPKA